MKISHFIKLVFLLSLALAPLHGLYAACPCEADLSEEEQQELEMQNSNEGVVQ